MSARKKPLAINLVPQDPFLESPLGRFMQWAMGAGRYIVIFTEIIVILSFAARFTLDRQITDLNDKLNQQVNMIKGFQDLEAEIRLVQTQTEEIKKQQNSDNMLKVFEELTRIIPVDVTLEKMQISRTGVSAQGVALSQSAFSQLVNNMQLSGKFYSVRIGKIESIESGSTAVSFTITADTGQAPQVKAAPQPVKETTEENILE